MALTNKHKDFETESPLQLYLKAHLNTLGKSKYQELKLKNETKLTNQEQPARPSSDEEVAETMAVS